MKTPPAMPENSAEIDPESWANYWRDVKNIRTTMTAEARKVYDKRRNAEITTRRQVAKLHELMKRYPDEVQYTLHPDTRPGPAVRPTVDPRDYYTPNS